MPAVDAYVALGSNLGDRLANLRAGLSGMTRRGLAPVRLSSLWETEPVGWPGAPWFLNMAAAIETDREPIAILADLLDVEREVGRIRWAPNAPRVLDLDLLAVGAIVVDLPVLTLPHARMWERRFVREPLAEIAPGLRDPKSGRTVAEALAALGPGPEVRPAGNLAWPQDEPV